MSETGIVEALVVAVVGFTVAYAWTAKDAEHEMAVCQFEWAKQETANKSLQELERWGYVPPDGKLADKLFDREFAAMEGKKSEFTRLCMVAAGFKQVTQGDLCKDVQRTVYWPVCWPQKRWWN